jgi:hypothetical protein
MNGNDEARGREDEKEREVGSSRVGEEGRTRAWRNSVVQLIPSYIMLRSKAPRNAIGE